MSKEVNQLRQKRDYAKRQLHEVQNDEKALTRAGSLLKPICDALAVNTLNLVPEYIPVVCKELNNAFAF